MGKLGNLGVFLAGLGVFLYFLSLIGFDLIELYNYLDMKLWSDGVSKRVAP